MGSLRVLFWRQLLIMPVIFSSLPLRRRLRCRSSMVEASGPVFEDESHDFPFGSPVDLAFFHESENVFHLAVGLLLLFDLHVQI